LGSKRPQTMAKRARELALKERRERKVAKKAERAETGSTGISDEVYYGGVVTPDSTIEPGDDSSD
jgi:hypothetical protein